MKTAFFVIIQSLISRGLCYSKTKFLLNAILFLIIGVRLQPRINL